jgi:hypothetical protein
MRSSDHQTTCRVKLDVFGQRYLVERVDGQWHAYALGSDGKRSPFHVAIPSALGENELAQYFDDLYHEASTPRHPNVIRLPE